MGCIVDDVMKIVLLAVALPCGFVVCICCIASERLNHDRSDLYSFEPLWWTRIPGHCMSAHAMPVSALP